MNSKHLDTMYNLFSWLCMIVSISFLWIADDYQIKIMVLYLSIGFFALFASLFFQLLRVLIRIWDLLYRIEFERFDTKI